MAITERREQLEKAEQLALPMEEAEKKLARAGDARTTGMLAEKSEGTTLKQQVAGREYPPDVEAGHEIGNAVSPDDYMTMDALRFRTETQQALADQGLTSKAVAADDSGAKAEAYTKTVFQHEGIPDGSGGVQRVRGVTEGQYGGPHGVDLVAATEQGNPVVIEVKKREDPVQAELTRKGIDQANLEPEVQRWVQQRSTAEGDPIEVKQMDDYWVKDRWLKLVKSPEGQARLQGAGVHPKYLRPENFQAEDSPLWRPILDNKVAAVVSARDDPSGNTMLRQAVFERRVHRVMRIYTG